MDILLVTTLVTLGLASLALASKKYYRSVEIFQALFAVVGIFWMSSSFNEEATSSFYILSGVTVFGFLLAQFISSNKWLGAAVPLVIGLGFMYVIGANTMELNDIEFVPEAKFLILAIIIAALGSVITDLKLQLFKSLISESEQEGWLKSVYLLFAGFSVFLGMFSAPGIGVLTVGVVFLVGSFFRKDDSGSLGVSLVALSLIPVLTLNLDTAPTLLSGDVLEGLFIGAFGMYMVSQVWKSERSNPLLISIAYIAPVALIVGIGFAGGQLELMGGLDAMIASVVGASIVNIVAGKHYSGVSYISILLASVLMFSQKAPNEEMEESQEQIITMKGGTDTEGNEVAPPKVLALSELEGNHKFEMDSSVVLFRLGANGATKGKFKKVSGSIHIASDITKSSVRVKMDMEDFTTFSKSRDGHLRKEEYFNVTKYPRMTYRGSLFTQVKENVYEVDGEFTMLGVTKPLKVTMQRIEFGDQKVIIGSGTIDRTQFGMTPSASEGNVVDFDYQVLLQK